MSRDAHETLKIDRAETEVIAVAIRKPQLWSRICHVRAEWFRSWNRQTVWAAIRHSYDLNDGLTEPQVMLDWFREHCDESEIDGLADEMLACATSFLHAEYLDHHLGILERAGERLAIERWAGHIAEICRSGRAIRDIRSAVLSPPLNERGAA